MKETITLQNKRDTIRDAVAFKDTSRVPFIMWAWQWKFIDSDLNVTIEDGTRDYDLQEKVIREFLGRYHFDSIFERCCIYNTKQLDALGGQPARILEGNKINNIDRQLLPFDLVDQYLENPTMMQYIIRGNKYHPGMTFGNLLDAIAAGAEYNQFAQKVEQIYAEYQVPRLFPQEKMFMLPIEMVEFDFGGIKDFAVFMRRYPDRMQHFVDVKSAAFRQQVDAALDKPTPDDSVYDSSTTYLVHSFMNKKQIERYFYPDMKYMMDKVNEHGATLTHNIEAECLRLADYLIDQPKGTHAIHVEIEDVRDVRKAIPNVAIEGGMPVTLLSRGTVEEVQAFAKELVDTMGNGYIMSMNKFMNYNYDGTRENVKALSEFVLNYKP